MLKKKERFVCLKSCLCAFQGSWELAHQPKPPKERSQRQEGSKLKLECDRSSTDAANKGFNEDTVSGEQMFECAVISSFVMLSQQDYINEFSGSHRSKDPKCPCISVVNHHGEIEKAWIFRDPERPFRRLEVKSMVGERRSTDIMKGSDHLHSRQGTLVVQGALNARVSGSALMEVIGKNPCLSSVEEYAEKLRKRRGGEGEDGDGAADDAIQVDASPPDSKSGGAKVNEDEFQDGQPAVSTAAAAAVVVATSCRGMPSTFVTPDQEAKRRKVAGFAAASASLKRASSSRSMHDADDDQPEVAESEAAASRDSQGTGAQKGESPQQTCSRWLAKVNVRSILQGRKMGVSLRHAETACSKLPVKERLILTNHLRMARAAEALGSGNLSSLGQAALEEHINTLSTLKLEDWPVAVQRGLFELHQSELVNRVVSGLGKTEFMDLWSRVRPHCCKDDAATTLLDPHLRNLSFKGDEAVEIFMDIMVTQLFLPMILAGEPKQKNTLAFCLALLEVIEQDLAAEELEDGVVEALFDLQVAARVVEQIINLDWTVLGDHREVLTSLKGSSEGKSPTLEHLSNAILETSFYSARLTECLKALRTLELHEGLLSQAKEEINSEPDLQATCLDTFCNTLRYMPTLVDDVPVQIMDPMMEGLKKKFLKLWVMFKTKFADTDASANQEQMQTVVFEASLCFAQDKAVCEVKDEFAELLVSVVGNKKMKKLVEVLVEMEKQMCEQKTLPPQNEMSKVIEEARAAQGLSVAEDQKAVMTTFMGDMLKLSFAGIDEKSPEDILLAVDVLRAVMATGQVASKEHGWVPQVEKLAGLGKWHALMMKFEQLGKNLEAQLRDPAGENLLADIMRGMDQSKDWAECEGLGEDVKQDLLKKATRLREDSRFVLTEVADIALREAMANAQPKAGGAELGASWDQGLPVNAGWEQTLEKARTTLLAITKPAFQELERAKNELQEVDVYVKHLRKHSVGD